MKRRITPRDIIIYTLCMSVIFLTLIDSTYKLVGVIYNFWLMVGIVTGIILYVFLIHRVKFAWISIGLLFLIPKPLYIIKFFKAFLTHLKEFIDSVIQNEYILEKYFSYFNNIIFIIIPVLIIVFYIIVVVKKNTVVLIVFGGALISIYYYIGLNNLIINCNVFLIASFILFSYNNYSLMWSKWDYKNVKIESGYFLRVIISNLILVLLVICSIRVLPMDRKPLSLNWFQSELLDRFENLRTSEDSTLSEGAYNSKFSLSYTGYQQDARRLGGPVKDNYSLALRVRSEASIGGLHLRGTIKDLYNGAMWDKSDKKPKKFKDKLEIEDFSIPYKIKEMEIIHDGIKTTTAFNALYPYILTNSFKYGFIDSDLETFNPRVIKLGKSYSVTFKEYNLDQKTLLEKGPDRIVRASTSYHDKNLKLPEIPSRVYDLTKDITGKYDSPYMKASAIEDYLKRNYPYSKDTSILPEGRDFVDYFLFDEKKGSCSYYATALTVMARITGIPARYVEGFVVPYSQSSDGYTEVFNSDAHAWVELYLDGVGWVTFDPTPGNSSAAYQFPRDIENNNDTPSENTEQNRNTNINKDDKDLEERSPNEAGGEAGNINNKTSIAYILLYVLLGILAFGLLLFLTSLIVYTSINIFIRRNKRIIDFSKYKMLLYGKLTYIPYREGETLREYLEVLSNKLQIKLDNYILVYEKALYAKHNISPEELDKITDTMLKVRKKAIERNSRIRFYYRDYINTMDFYIRNSKKNYY